MPIQTIIKAKKKYNFFIKINIAYRKKISKDKFWQEQQKAIASYSWYCCINFLFKNISKRREVPPTQERGFNFSKFMFTYVTTIIKTYKRYILYHIVKNG